MSGKVSHELPLVDALMRERTGLTVRHLQAEERSRVLTTAMQRAGFSSDAAFAVFLRSYPSRLLDLASELSVGETYFFRDPGQLSLLMNSVLPRLLVERPRAHVFKVWSAGCASGEEAYTMAMLLDERGLLGRAQVVGTDISEVALSRARQGLYGTWSLRAAPSLATQRYFKPSKRSFQLSSALMAQVKFERQSLTDSAAPLPGGVDGPFDLILCRNVLIYFTEHACSEASSRLAQCLAVGGTLCAGASDHFAELPELWRRSTHDVGTLFTRIAPASELRSHPEPRASTRRGAGTTSAGPAQPARARLARAPVEARGSAREPRLATRPQLPRGSTRKVGKLAEPQPLSQLDELRRVAKHEGSAGAVEACQRALRDDPTSTELQLWLSALLIELDRDDEAELSLRTLLYLDRHLVMGHLLSALVWRRRGERSKAARAYRRVVALCQAQPEDEPVPMGEGLNHRTLAETAAAEARCLERKAGTS